MKKPKPNTRKRGLPALLPIPRPSQFTDGCWTVAADDEETHCPLGWLTTACGLDDNHVSALGPSAVAFVRDLIRECKRISGTAELLAIQDGLDFFKAFTSWIDDIVSYRVGWRETMARAWIRTARKHGYDC